MPGSQFFGTALANAVNNNQVTMDRLNDMVTRMLTAMYAVGPMNSPNPTGMLLLLPPLFKLIG